MAAMAGRSEAGGCFPGAPAGTSVTALQDATLSVCHCCGHLPSLRPLSLVQLVQLWPRCPQAIRKLQEAGERTAHTEQPSVQNGVPTGGGSGTVV